MENTHLVFIGAGILSLVSIKRLLEILEPHQSHYHITVLEQHSQGAAGTSYSNGGSLTAIEGLSAIKPGSSALTTLHPAISGNKVDKGWLLRPQANLPLHTQHWIEQASCILNPTSSDVYFQSAKHLANLGSHSLEYTSKFFKKNPALAKKALFNYYPAETKQFTCRYTAPELYADHHLLLEKLGLTAYSHPEHQEISLAGGCMNARLFALALIDQLQQAGVTFHFNTKISSLKYDKILILPTGEIIKADKIIISTGCDLSIFNMLDITIPIAPIGGCTLTVPIAPSIDAFSPFKLITPKGAIVFSPFFTPEGRYLRIGGISWLDPDMNIDITSSQAAHGFDVLKHYLYLLFPNIYRHAEHLQQWSPWVGFRPYTSDFLPIIGEIKPGSDIWINMGHGPGGTAYSFGAAHILLQQLLPHIRLPLHNMDQKIFSLQQRISVI